MLFLSAMAFAAPYIPQGAAMAATQSFDQITGVLSIDYAHYLSKHNIVFNSKISDGSGGLTVGNGRVGAMVWNPS
jgi:hypothetical protein